MLTSEQRRTAMGKALAERQVEFSKELLCHINHCKRRLLTLGNVPRYCCFTRLLRFMKERACFAFYKKITHPSNNMCQVHLSIKRLGYFSQKTLFAQKISSTYSYYLSSTREANSFLAFTVDSTCDAYF